MSAQEIQEAVLEAAGLHPGCDNTGITPRPVPIQMKTTGKTISVNWDVALQRILTGAATLAAEPIQELRGYPFQDIPE
jgi:hypothetical protein